MTEGEGARTVAERLHAAVNAIQLADQRGAVHITVTLGCVPIRVTAAPLYSICFDGARAAARGATQRRKSNRYG